ncbi:MAG: sulfurtransferase [Deltaproteobacteria bacterium]|nr:sulfurtransferase [Deltaproteobacteria bacterium]
MFWKKLLHKAPVLTAEEVRDYMADHPAESYQLLDVRQPGEYQEKHLPGAKLVPVGELEGRLDELDPGKPVITYCAVGGRSRAAAQLLAGRGFAEVYNLAGGIKAWQERTAAGPQEWGLDLAPTGQGPAAVLRVAARLERGLQEFYGEVSRRTEDEGLRKLSQRLGAWEHKHLERLRGLFEALPAAERGSAPLWEEDRPVLMEGGYRLADFLEASGTAAGEEGPHWLLDLALALETQSLDLYLRLADHTDRADEKEVFQGVAAEERQHLTALSELYDQLSA